MNIFSAASILWKNKAIIGQLEGAEREAQQGKYELARQHFLAVVEPPLYAGGAAALTAAIAYFQPVWTSFQNCLEVSIAPQTCVDHVNWQENGVHMLFVAGAGFAAGLKLYLMQPRKRPEA